jgi:hypothetical protein
MPPYDRHVDVLWVRYERAPLGASDVPDAERFRMLFAVLTNEFSITFLLYLLESRYAYVFFGATTRMQNL